MPWCDSCDEYRAPNALADDGTCRRCGSTVDAEDTRVATHGGPPWHFWLMVLALAIYLGWRAVQFVIWVIR